jgi:hypothetical protein
MSDSAVNRNNFLRGGDMAEKNVWRHPTEEELKKIRENDRKRNENILVQTQLGKFDRDEAYALFM